MKLHLGCGRVLIPGWLNVDKVNSTQGRLSDCVFRTDLRKPWPWSDESIELITISHLLYCMTWAERLFVIEEASRVLQRGGILRVTEDDNDNPSSKYHVDLHHNAVERMAMSELLEIMRHRFSEVHEVNASRTLAGDRRILQDLHGSGDEIFFLEGVK